MYLLVFARYHSTGKYRSLLVAINLIASEFNINSVNFADYICSSVELMSKLSATCLQGCVHLWDLKGLDKCESFSKFTEKIDNNNHTIWGGRFLHQNRNVFVTIDGSGAVKSWKYEDPKLSSETNNDNSKNVPSYLEKLQECQISDQPISAFDWSPDMPGLAVSTSFDQKVRLLAFTNLDKL